MLPWLRRVVLVFVLAGVLAATGCTPPKSETTAPTATPQSSSVVVPTSSATPSTAPTCGVDAAEEIRYSKPAIYLYPPRRTEVRVRLAVDGVITRTDPPIDPIEGWRVVADPSGTLVSLSSGRTCPYLFWEADAAISFDMSTGFVVRGRDTRRFLSGKLAALGLSFSEADAFMEYWVPLMESNAYNLVHFEGPTYERSARLLVAPEPDMLVRVFMVYRSLAAPVAVTSQQLSSPAPRRGFVLVEWGGTELPAP